MTTVIFNGATYPVEFAGYDRQTYKHARGCLAYSEHHQGGLPGACCQCAAMDRADKWFQFKVPAAKPTTGDAT